MEEQELIKESNYLRARLDKAEKKVLVMFVALALTVLPVMLLTHKVRDMKQKAIQSGAAYHNIYTGKFEWTIDVEKEATP
jgi:hypothetical protein